MVVVVIRKSFSMLKLHTKEQVPTAKPRTIVQLTIERAVDVWLAMNLTGIR